jgi:N-acetylmuramoyl-L-alanine amidase
MNTGKHGWSGRVLYYLCASAFICGSLLGCASSKKQHEAPPTVVDKQPMSVDEAMRLIDRRADWTEFPPINIPRHPAEKFLKDVTIVVDPGHGGADGGNTSTQPAGYKAGRGGEKEAHINLRVGLLLERLLKDAGANVILTRHGDDTLSLRERAEIANNAKKVDGSTGADLFVSIHHNAGSRGSNYPSVWYHGAVDDNEVDLDVARYLALELGKMTRTQVAKTSPVFSSHLMYNTGFGVLRACHVPAVLLECSFFSDPDEEQRLKDAGYNLREAYAVYVGLCEWAYSGRPTQSTPVVTRTGSAAVIRTTLDDGLPQGWWGADRGRIVRSTVQAALDGKVLAIEFDPATRALTADLPPGALDDGKPHVLTIHHANMMKNHNWPQRYEIAVAADGPGVRVTPLPASRPPRTWQPAASTSKPTTGATTRRWGRGRGRTAATLPASSPSAGDR